MKNKIQSRKQMFPVFAAGFTAGITGKTPANYAEKAISNKMGALGGGG